MHLGQYRGFRPACQPPSQGRAADLIDAGTQAAPPRSDPPEASTASRRN
jgi:hypothetical protein